MTLSQKGDEPHEIFFKEIVPQIKSMSVFYTLFAKNYKMRWMGHKEKKTKLKLAKPYLNFDEILDKLINSFPMICIWRIKDFLKQNNIHCLVDHCSLQNSDAWGQIQDMLINVFFSGDKCNPLISTADIMIKLIHLRLSKSKKFYQYGNFRAEFPELNNKVYEYSISHRHYREISPLDKKLVNLRKNYMTHPIFYVLNENKDFIDSNSLKSDPGLNKIYNLASQKGGSLKIYEKKEDLKHIKNGDYVIYFTENGEKIVRTMKKLGKKINGIDISAV